MTALKLPVPAWLHRAMTSDTAYDRFVDSLAESGASFTIDSGHETTTVALDGALVFFTRRGAFRGLVVRRDEPLTFSRRSCKMTAAGRNTMKTLILVVLAAVPFAVSGCAAARKPEPTIVTCGRAPTSYLTDADGVPNVGLYTCYRTDGLIAYRAQELTAEEKAAARAALQAAMPTPSPADPCSGKDGKEYTRCRILQKASKKAGSGLQPVGKP